MPISRLALFLAAGLAAAPLASLAQGDTPPPPAPPVPPAAPMLPASPHLVANGNLVSTLQGSGDFTVLVKALNATNLTATLKAAPGLTLFAPTDQAFNALPKDQLAALMAPANLPLLQKVLIYHLVNASVDSSKIKGAKGPVASVESGPLIVDGSGPVLKVNDANIIQSDVRATNGIIQVVDKVLIPPGVTLPTASAAAAATPAGG